MVLKDSDDTLSSQQVDYSHKPDADMWLARPADRIAAAVIDYAIILLPVVYLLLAPFQRLAKESVLVETGEATNLIMVFALGAVLALVILYQTIALWLFSGTPGQRILGLRVQQFWPRRPLSLSQAFYRAWCWVGTLFLGGAPLASVYSHELRRALHDRMTDTFVTTLKIQRRALPPTPQERVVVRGFLAAGFTFVFTFVISVASVYINKTRSKNELIASLEDEDRLCAVVGEVQNEWPEISKVRGNENEEIDRLSVALSLFAAGAIDVKCLESEVKELHSDKSNEPLVLLAKSFIYVDHQDLSDRYLKEICKASPSSSECVASELLGLAVQTESIKRDESLAVRMSLIAETSPTYLLVWASEQAFRIGKYDLAKKYVEEIPRHQEFNNFTLPLKAKLKWLDHDYETSLGFAEATYPSLSSQAQLQLSSFFCFENIWQNCQAIQSSHCQQFERNSEADDVDLQDEVVAITYIQNWECRNDSAKRDYDILLARDLNPNVKMLVRALQDNGTDGFSELLEGEDVSEGFRDEVLRRIVQRTQSSKLLDIVHKEWAVKKASDGWVKIGQTLVSKYFDLKAYEKSLQVTDQLLAQASAFNLDRRVLEQSIVAAVRNNDWDRGRELLGRFGDRFPMQLQNRGREIASEGSEFRAALKQLLSAERSGSQ